MSYIFFSQVNFYPKLSSTSSQADFKLFKSKKHVEHWNKIIKTYFHRSNSLTYPDMFVRFGSKTRWPWCCRPWPPGPCRLPPTSRPGVPSRPPPAARRSRQRGLNRRFSPLKEGETKVPKIVFEHTSVVSFGFYRFVLYTFWSCLDLVDRRFCMLFDHNSYVLLHCWNMTSGKTWPLALGDLSASKKRAAASANKASATLLELPEFLASSNARCAVLGQLCFLFCTGLVCNGPNQSKS